MDAAMLHELFEYRDGELFWKTSNGNRAKIGYSAGSYRKDGRCTIRVEKRLYLRYRLIFLMKHGYLPKIIDHIDGNPANDRIENLRAATQLGNMANSKIPVTNVSGIKGVSWHKLRQKWRAHCQVNKKSVHLGLFDNIQDAKKAVTLYRTEHHGNFARHN